MRRLLSGVGDYVIEASAAYDWRMIFMTRAMLVGILALAFTSPMPIAAQNGAPNTLSASEQKEGFELLFDGKSLDKFIVPESQVKVWRVVNGVIHNDQTNPGATILTKEDFTNFVIRAEFRAHPNVNSALMLRQGRPQPAGYELQIRDKVLTDRTGGEYLTGSIVNVAHAPDGTMIVPKQWNYVRSDLERRLHPRHVQRQESRRRARQAARRGRHRLAVGASRGSGRGVRRVQES